MSDINQWRTVIVALVVAITGVLVMFALPVESREANLGVILGLLQTIVISVAGKATVQHGSQAVADVVKDYLLAKSEATDPGKRR